MSHGKKDSQLTPTIGKEMTVEFTNCWEQISELAKKCSIEEKHQPYIDAMIALLPKGPATIMYKESTIPWQPLEKIIGKNGVLDDIKEKEALVLLPDHALIALAIMGRIKEQTITLKPYSDGKFTRIELKKFIKRSLKLIRNEFCFFDKHRRQKVYFGSIIESTTAITTASPENSHTCMHKESLSMAATG